MLPWYEDDRFWAMLETQLFDEERKKAAIADVDNVLKLLQLEPGTEILDLCCGNRNHAALGVTPMRPAETFLGVFFSCRSSFVISGDLSTDVLLFKYCFILQRKRR